VLGRALSLLGDHAAALSELEPAHEAAPRDERVLEALLRSEAALRGVPAALERYERHRSRLADELGTDPSPELRRVHAELLARDRPVREGLLHESSRLIGRDDDVAALSAMIRTSRVTSIVGAGGLGKTRLAHLLGRLADQPVVHFVELAGVTSPDGVAVEVGSVLGVRESVAERRLQHTAERHDLHGRILERIGGVPALLILDNCEHLVEAVADLVAVLVARSAQLRVLTTTRAPLGLASERVYTLSTLGRDDAVELFRERATSARPGVRLEEARVASLVDRLDCLPLAVELAAAKVRVMSVEEIERRLENRFALLRGGSRDAPERHQTLLAVIDWSWNLLDEEERLALRRLSAFRDGFSLEGAEAVLGLPDAVGVVTGLVDQSLVSVHEAETLRFRLLETVREFGRMQLVDAGDDEPVERLLREWAVAYADRGDRRMFSPDQVAAVREMRIEEGNLTDVLRRALADGDVPTTIAVMAALADFWTVEGNHLKVVNVAEPVEDLVVGADVPPELETPVRAILGILAVNTMIFSGAPAPRSVARLGELGPGTEGGRVAALVRVVLAITESGPSAQGDRLDDLCSDPDVEVSRLAYQWRSQVRENSGDLPGALADAREALRLSDDRQGPWARALLAAQLAALAVQVGDQEAGRAYGEQSLAAMERLGAVEDTVQLKAMLAVLEIEAGRFDQAERLFAEVADQEPNQSIIGGTLMLLCGRAELALARGEIDEGLRLYRSSAAVMRERGLSGVDRPLEMTPWVLFPEAASLSAHVRHGVRGPVATLRDSLVEKTRRLLSEATTFLDYPMTGSLLCALGLWELTRDDPGPLAVRLLVLADGFGYNRMLPSLGWRYAADLAESRFPGMADAYAAEIAGRSAVELRDDVRRVVAELD
jgi:predicted ATPase/tetratricopeptide (TPR) repeat protein